MQLTPQQIDIAKDLYTRMTCAEMAVEFSRILGRPVSKALMSKVLSNYGIEDPKRKEMEERRDVILRLARRGTIKEIAEFMRLYHGCDLRNSAIRMMIRRAVGRRTMLRLMRRWKKLDRQERNRLRRIKRLEKKQQVRMRVCMKKKQRNRLKRINRAIKRRERMLGRVRTMRLVHRLSVPVIAAKLHMTCAVVRKLNHEIYRAELMRIVHMARRADCVQLSIAFQEEQQQQAA